MFTSIHENNSFKEKDLIAIQESVGTYPLVERGS